MNTTKLKRLIAGTNFGPIWAGSGAMNFFGEGYPYHRYLKTLLPLLFSFRGITFVAKTTTLNQRKGNMPLQADGATPVEFKPKCIHVGLKSFMTGSTLNAVALSGPGAVALLEDGRWQARKEPFMISFMSVAPTYMDRLNEAKEFAQLLKRYLNGFQTDVGLQINFSCPNVGINHAKDIDKFVEEVKKTLELFEDCLVALVPKITPEIPVEAALEIADHQLCNGICISNTINFNKMSTEDRLRYFGQTVSPLENFGGGGASGPYLRRLITGWIPRFRQYNKRIHINAGGGILHPRHVRELCALDIDSVSVGAITMVRPWWLQPTVRTAHKCL